MPNNALSMKALPLAISCFTWINKNIDVMNTIT